MEDGQLAQHLTQLGYLYELGARSLQKAVHRQIKQKLAHAFLLEKTQVNEGINQEPMACYEVRLVNACNNNHEVELERNCVKDIQQRKKERM